MASNSSSSASSTLPFQRDAAFVSSPHGFDDYEAPTAETLEDQAMSVLVDQLGSARGRVSTGYACGTVGVQADQTHYSGGFALLMPLQQGIGIAVRPGEASVVLSGENAQMWTSDGDDPPAWVVAVHRIVQELFPEQSLEVAVVSTVPSVCRDGYLAALAVALIRALRSLDLPASVDLGNVQSLRDDLIPLLAAELGTAVNRPYGSAYLLATFAGADPAFTLVDTTTREHLPVETEARNELRWAIFDPVTQDPRAPSFHRERQQQADDALRRLRTTDFPALEAFRDLDYRDLEDALELLPEPIRPVVRHLVTENHRVQKHVAAMRRGDWQMIGGLLLMSHASQRDEWNGTSPAADALVAEAETRTHDGLYGACMTGRSGAVLVTGRPNAFEEGLRHVSEAVTPVLGHAPRILKP